MRDNKDDREMKRLRQHPYLEKQITPNTVFEIIINLHSHVKTRVYYS